MTKQQEIFGGIAIVAVIAVGFWFAKNQVQAPALPNPSPSPSTSQDGKTYQNSKARFSLQFPAEFTASPLAQKDAYPMRSYIGTDTSGIPGFVEAVFIKPAKERAFPNFEILVYHEQVQDVRIDSGFGKKETIELGEQQFEKFSEPAGDLVPGNMYIATNGEYVVQINTNMDLSGLPIEYTAEKILETFRFRE